MHVFFRDTQPKKDTQCWTRSLVHDDQVYSQNPNGKHFSSDLLKLDEADLFEKKCRFSHTNHPIWATLQAAFQLWKWWWCLLQSHWKLFIASFQKGTKKCQQHFLTPHFSKANFGRCWNEKTRKFSQSQTIQLGLASLLTQLPKQNLAAMMTSTPICTSPFE